MMREVFFLDSRKALLSQRKQKICLLNSIYDNILGTWKDARFSLREETCAGGPWLTNTYDTRVIADYSALELFSKFLGVRDARGVEVTVYFHSSV